MGLLDRLRKRKAPAKRASLSNHYLDRQRMQAERQSGGTVLAHDDYLLAAPLAIGSTFQRDDPAPAPSSGCDDPSPSPSHESYTSSDSGSSYDSGSSSSYDSGSSYDGGSSYDSGGGGGSCD